MNGAYKLARLGDLCDIKTGKKDVNQGNPNGLYPFFTCAKSHTYSDEYSFDCEAILIAGNGDVGNLNYYEGKFEAYQRTYVLMGFDGILPRYLYLVLEGMLKPALYDQRLGNTMPYIKKGMLTDFMVPVPPLSEQAAIVAILEEVYSGIESAISNAENNLASVRELFESYLNKVFNNPGDDWERSALGEVCSFQGGSQPPKAEFSPVWKEGYIRLIQIRDYKSDKNVVYIPEEKAKRFCAADDVMIGRYGPPLFQILRGLDGAYNVALMKAVPDEEKISKDYLYYFLQNASILRYVVNASSRAAGQSGLNKATIEPYPISYPSLASQENIVSMLRGLYEDVQRLEVIYKEKLVALRELKRSALQKAFSGDLTVKNDMLRGKVAV